MTVQLGPGTKNFRTAIKALAKHILKNRDYRVPSRHCTCTVLSFPKAGSCRAQASNPGLGTVMLGLGPEARLWD